MVNHSSKIGQDGKGKAPKWQTSKKDVQEGKITEPVNQQWKFLK